MKSSSSGAQHVEQAALILVVIVLAAAVGLSATSIGEAVARVMICNLDGKKCEGSVDGGELPAGSRPTARGLAATGASTTAVTNVNDLSDAHYPTKQGVSSGAGGLFDTPGTKSVPFDWCSAPTGASSSIGFASSTKLLCTAPDGGIWSCESIYAPGLDGTALTVNKCKSRNIRAEDMVCSPEGNNPKLLVCRPKNLAPDGNRMFHCYATPGSPGFLTCSDTNYDKDTELPDGKPVNCGSPSPDRVVCMGKNGTLYNCPRDSGGLSGGTCPGGGRNIPPTDPSLTECVAEPRHGPHAVRCSYTSVPNECLDGDLEGEPTPACEQTKVSVRCIRGGNGELNHCQSLGTDASPAVDAVEAGCVQRGAAGTCTATIPVAVENPLDPADVATKASLGTLDIQTEDGFDGLVTVPVNGKQVTMNNTQLTEHCEQNPAACEDIINGQSAGLQTSLFELLKGLGACTSDADCTTQMARFLAPADGKAATATGRGLQAIPGMPRIQLTLEQKQFATICLFIAACTAGQFVVNNVIDAKANNRPINGKAVGGIGVWAAISGGVIIASMTAIQGHFQRQIALRNAGLPVANSPGGAEGQAAIIQSLSALTTSTAQIAGTALAAASQALAQLPGVAQAAGTSAFNAVMTRIAQAAVAGGTAGTDQSAGNGDGDALLESCPSVGSLSEWMEAGNSAVNNC